MIRGLVAVNMAANTAMRAKAQQDANKNREESRKQREADREQRAADRAADREARAAEAQAAREMRAREMEARLELQRQQMMLKAGVPADAVLSQPAPTNALAQPVPAQVYEPMAPPQPSAEPMAPAAMHAPEVVPVQAVPLESAEPALQAAPMAAEPSAPLATAATATANPPSPSSSQRTSELLDQSIDATPMVVPVEAVVSRAKLELRMSPMFAISKKAKGKPVVYYGASVQWMDGKRPAANLALRYSELLTLHEAILRAFPDLRSELPPFPPKTGFLGGENKNSPKIVELRLIVLSHWLPFVLGHETILSIPLMQKLLAASPSHDN